MNVKHALHVLLTFALAAGSLFSQEAPGKVLTPAAEGSREIVKSAAAPRVVSNPVEGEVNFDTLVPALPVVPTTGEGQPNIGPRPLEKAMTQVFDGELWGAGKAWKARFGADAFEFVPFFGSQAPKNYPIRMSLAALQVGEDPMPLTKGIRPTVLAERVSYDRGLLTESYDLKLDSVEQSFRLETSPGAGAIVLDIDVASELELETAAQGLAFVGEQGSVSYSQAIVIDAAGRKTAIETQVRSGGIRIAIPASLAADLSYPIVIDPVLNPQPTYVPYDNLLSIDIAFAIGDQRWLVIGEYEFSAADHDIHGWVFDFDGNYLTQVYIDLTTNSWKTPSVAANNLAGTFLTVANVPFTATTSNIMGRTLDAGSYALGTSQTYTAIAGANANPVVGGDPALAPPTYFFVVWEHEFSSFDHDIIARLVSGTGLPASPSVIPLDTTTVDDRHPCISKTDGTLLGSQQFWAVAWDRDAGGEHDIIAQRITYNGNLIGGAIAVHSSGLDTVRPRVSAPDDGMFGQRRWVCAYETVSIATPDVGITMLSESTVRSTYSSIGSAFGLPADLRKHPSVETDGCRFALAYKAPFGEIKLSSFSFDGANVVHPVELDVDFGLAYFADATPMLATSDGFGTGPVKFMGSFLQTYLIGNGNTFDSSFYQLSGAAGGVLRLTTATDGLDLQQIGIPTLGQTIVVELTNPVFPAYLVVGAPMAPVVVCGMPIGIDLNLPYTIYDTSILVGTIPCVPQVVGYVFAVQGADKGGLGCFNWRVSDTVITQIQ